MTIKMTGVCVSDPLAAFEFYTKTLGFKELFFMPEAQLAIVVSKEQPDGTALMLEPDSNPISKTYQEALLAAEIPVIVFGTENIEEEYARLQQEGVVFRKGPTDTGWGIEAIFEDGFGNLIKIHKNA